MSEIQKALYMGDEFPQYIACECEVFNDELNGVYSIVFIDDSFQVDNIFEEELTFLN